MPGEKEDFEEIGIVNAIGVVAGQQIAVTACIEEDADPAEGFVEVDSC